MSDIKQIRSPVYGVMFANGCRKISVNPPLTDNEVPVVICLRPDAVRVSARKPEAIELTNYTDRAQPYCVVVASRWFALLMTSSWGQRIQKILENLSVNPPPPEKTS